MIDLDTVASIVTTLSIVVGVVFTILEIRHLGKNRKTEVIMKIYDRFGTREIVEAINRVGNARFESIEDYNKKYGFTDVTQIAELFEGIGVLLEQGLIDIKMVDKLFGPTLNLLWVRMKPVLYSMREGLNEPFFFSHYEYLINRLNSYRESNK
jgi:DNA-binding ferritin-like protein (Dps family)